MDKKTLPILIALIALLIFYWPILKFLGLTDETEQPAEQPVVTDTVPATASRAVDTVFVERPTDRPQQAAITEPVVEESELEPDTMAVDTIVVETGKYLFTMTTRGGGPVSIILKNYGLRDGTPIQMIPGDSVGAPVASFQGGTFSTGNKHFAASLPAGNYDATSSELELTYTYIHPVSYTHLTLPTN